MVRPNSWTALGLVLAIFAPALSNAPVWAFPTNDSFSEFSTNLKIAQAAPAFKLGPDGKPIPTGPDLVTQANGYYLAGEKAFYKNDLGTAESMLKKSIDCRDELKKVREPKDYLKGVDTLCKVLRKQNKFDEAEKYYRKGLSMASQGLGPTAYEVKSSLVNLADVCEKQQKYPDALGYYKQLQKITEGRDGYDDPDAQEYRKKILDINIKGGNYDEAENLLKNSINHQEAQGKGNSPETIKMLDRYADVLKRACKIEEAEAIEAKVKGLKEASAP